MSCIIRVRSACVPLVLLIMIGALSCSSSSVKRISLIGEDNLPDPNDSGTITNIEHDFSKVSRRLAVTKDGDFVNLEGDGLPEHEMMVGIESASLLVPLPQNYSNENAWRLPIKPVRAKRGVSITDCFYNGVIAIAINGVPIVSPLNEDGVHSFTPSELDFFGGHCGCGRGDEYHYHLAPTHLQSVAGAGNPIAYALDGYPIYGFESSDGKVLKDLDEYHGRIEGGIYRYYASPSFPYVNGGLRGAVEIRDGQVFPQPKNWPKRVKSASMKAGKIIDYSYEPTTKSHSYQYTGSNYRNTEFIIQDSDTISFKVTTMLNETIQSVLRRSDSIEQSQIVEPRREDGVNLPTVILRIPNDYEGYVFFILDPKAPVLAPKYGRLVIDIPKSCVLHVPEIKQIGSHYSVYAEYMDGRRILTPTRNLIGEKESESRFSRLEDGGSGTKQDANGKSITWIAFYIGKNGRPGVVPAFPPGL